MAKEKISGIYCIENLVNGKKYIGQSCNIKARWYNHKYCLNNDRHSNHYLQNSWNKYGSENFNFYILEKCNQNIINDKERYYISQYNTMDKSNGYNLDSSGNLNKKHSIETRIKMSNSAKGKILSMETRKKISINRSGKLFGKNHPMYGKKVSPEQAKLLRMYAKSRYGDKCYQAKKIICINTQEIFNTIREAEIKYKQYGVNNQNLSKCCNGKRNYCGLDKNGIELQWAYYDKNKKYEYKPLLLPPSNNMKKNMQFDKDFNYIATYESAREAERITNISYKQISQGCNKNKKYVHGYIWRFFDESLLN